MSPIEHYFENLITHGSDIKGEPNKNVLSKEVQTTVEECAVYTRNTLLEDIMSEIANYKLSEEEKEDMDEDSIKWGLKIAYDLLDKHISRKEQQGGQA